VEVIAPRQEAAAAMLSLTALRDRLVLANERVAAELVESCIATLQDACRGLLGRTER
jgi:hypothetical protein